MFQKFSNNPNQNGKYLITFCYKNVFGLDEIQSFCDYKINKAQMMISVTDWKTMWENEKLLVNSICPFLSMFSKALPFKVFKSKDCLIEA